MGDREVSLPGGRHRREGRRRVCSPANSCSARQAFTEPPSSSCRPAVACHQSPRHVSNPSVATQTPALGLRGRPWLLASWFLNLCVWLWTLAAVVHPGLLPPNTVHGPVLVSETRNANREMRQVRTLWHQMSRITFLPVCYRIPGTWLGLMNVSAESGKLWLQV